MMNRGRKMDYGRPVPRTSVQDRLRPKAVCRTDSVFSTFPGEAIPDVGTVERNTISSGNEKKQEETISPGGPANLSVTFTRDGGYEVTRLRGSNKAAGSVQPSEGPSPDKGPEGAVSPGGPANLSVTFTRDGGYEVKRPPPLNKSRGPVHSRLGGRPSIGYSPVSSRGDEVKRERVSVQSRLIPKTRIVTDIFPPSPPPETPKPSLPLRKSVQSRLTPKAAIPFVNSREKEIENLTSMFGAAGLSPPPTPTAKSNSNTSIPTVAIPELSNSGQGDANSGEKKPASSPDKNCICFRPARYVYCTKCRGKLMAGRKARLCPSHPSHMYLLDIYSCKECGTDENLKEFVIPQKHSGKFSKMANPRVDNIKTGV